MKTRDQTLDYIHSKRYNMSLVWETKWLYPTQIFDQQVLHQSLFETQMLKTMVSNSFTKLSDHLILRWLPQHIQFLIAGSSQP